MPHPFYINPTKVSTSCGSIVHFWSRGLDTVSRDEPVLVLVHGYPQSSFMYVCTLLSSHDSQRIDSVNGNVRGSRFRHLIPLLPFELALFVPDLPGYGDSTPSIKDHDKRTISTALLEALSASLPKGTTPQCILLAGHDRGARISHRLAVDAPLHPSFSIRSLILLDIVPTLTQWASFTSAPGITSSFHWPFLANSGLATELIMAKGGGWWCQSLIHRWAGTNPKRLYMLEEDAAMQIYGDHFGKETVVRASCEDYKAGATVDVDAQKADQEAGRKIKVPTLILFSAKYLGERYDVKGIWREWVDEGVEVSAEGIGDGCGHFLPEEAPTEVAGLMKSWIEGVCLRRPGL